MAGFYCMRILENLLGKFPTMTTRIITRKRIFEFKLINKDIVCNFSLYKERICLYIVQAAEEIRKGKVELRTDPSSKKRSMEIEELGSCEALPLLSLNHVSLLCRSVWTSARFYEEVLGFVLIKRPSSFKFNGAWLYSYGIGIHLIENPSLDELDHFPESRPINPKDNHISFQCTDVDLVKKRLEGMGMVYETAVVEDDGIKVDQVFFHDPDGYMVELCNCENIPILPLSNSCSFKRRMGSFRKTAPSNCGFMENMMMESLSMEMMNISF